MCACVSVCMWDCVHVSVRRCVYECMFVCMHVYVWEGEVVGEGVFVSEYV